MGSASSGTLGFAVENHGRPAIFSNAGVGEIPVILRPNKDRYEAIIAACDDYVEEHLPIRGRRLRVSRLPSVRS